MGLCWRDSDGLDDGVLLGIGCTGWRCADRLGRSRYGRGGLAGWRGLGGLDDGVEHRGVGKAGGVQTG
jgi:hypothetical protein